MTRSRLHAVRYRQAVDRWLEEHGQPFKALVAFSGEVRDGSVSYTESGMNGLAETQTAETFKRDEFRILICADKFQTGFDQPLLHTMYVDKKLAGVNAVQTLSRLNRVHPGKDETMVLDTSSTKPTRSRKRSSLTTTGRCSRRQPIRTCCMTPRRHSGSTRFTTTPT